MKHFPYHTALTIATVGVILTCVNLVVPPIKGPGLSLIADVISLGTKPLSPLERPLPPKPTRTLALEVRQSPLLLDDSGGALDHFYAALWHSERRESGAITRIVHYGDSPTTADLVTGEARHLLQQRFGNAGHGFVLLAKPWAWYQHTGVDIYALGWLIARATQFDARDGLFGLGGVSFSGDSAAHSRITFQRERYSQFEVSFLRQPGGGTFTVAADGQILGKVDTSEKSTSADFAAFQVEPGVRDLSILVDQGRVLLFGITAENLGPGLVYDSLGLNGGSVTVLARKFNEAHWAEELRHRRPDLVIMNYGTNEAGFATFVEKAYEGELREAIRRIHAALPNSSVLIMSPMDRGQRAESGEIETMPTIPRIVDIQRRVAGETSCAFFNTFNAMGGAGTMARWYSGIPRLVAADLIHPYGTGGKIVAGLFTKEILAGLARFKLRQGGLDGQDTQAVMPKPPASKEPAPPPYIPRSRTSGQLHHQPPRPTLRRPFGHPPTEDRATKRTGLQQELGLNLTCMAKGR